MYNWVISLLRSMAFFFVYAFKPLLSFYKNPVYASPIVKSIGVHGAATLAEVPHEPQICHWFRIVLVLITAERANGKLTSDQR